MSSHDSSSLSAKYFVDYGDEELVLMIKISKLMNVLGTEDLLSLSFFNIEFIELEGQEYLSIFHLLLILLNIWKRS